MRPNVKLLAIVLAAITALTLAGVYAGQDTAPPDTDGVKARAWQSSAAQAGARQDQAKDGPLSDAEAVAVPEPSTLVLLVLGGAGAMAIGRRRRRRRT